MIRNYFKIAVRNLLKNKGYSLINILGLAIGLASCLLILLYLTHEWNYDRFHEKSDRIYRMVQTFKSDSKEDAGASTPFPLGPALANEFPQSVETTARLYNLQTPKLSLGIKEENKFFKEPNFFFADSTILDIFTIELISGNPETALRNPLSVIISESVSEKYFGDKNPMGKSLFFEGRIYLTVTGVMKPLPSNSHVDIDFLASFNTLDEFYKSSYDQSWYWNPCWTYFLLDESSNIEQITSQLSSFADKYYHPNIPETEEVIMDVQPLTEIHLYSDLDQEIKQNGDIRYLYIFSIIAVIILVVACVNFMNLTTAKSAARAKEVGMRKTLGANRWTLFVQFMGESFLLTLLGFILASLIVYLTLPFFNELLHLSISLSLLNRAEFWAGIVGLYLLVSILSGVYPALFLSHFEPVKTIQGKITKSKKAALFRRLLVVMQFGMSAFLIIGTFFVYQQLTFLQQKNMGFDHADTVIIPTDLTRTIWFYDEFRQRLLEDANIRKVTGLRSVLGSLTNTYQTYIPEGQAEEQPFPTVFVMHDFIETYQIKLLAGRSFSEERATDQTQAVIVNQRLVDQLGWGSPEQAIGKTLEFTGDEGQVQYVIGVTENFHHTSLKRTIEPVILDIPNEDYGIVSRIQHIAVKINPGQQQAALDHIRESWQEFDTSHPFEYFFHESKLDEIYQPEKAMGNVATIFAILCVIVACLGLFGLISYMTESRSKEIGIRKSLGAGISNILVLISKDYMLLVLVSNLIAWPLVYYAIQRWLEDFAFRISIEEYLLPAFLGTAILIFAISLLTVSYHSVKTALINPAQTLRDE